MRCGPATPGTSNGTALTASIWRGPRLTHLEMLLGPFDTSPYLVLGFQFPGRFGHCSVGFESICYPHGKLLGQPLGVSAEFLFGGICGKFKSGSLVAIGWLIPHLQLLNISAGAQRHWLTIRIVFIFHSGWFFQPLSDWLGQRPLHFQLHWLLRFFMESIICRLCLINLYRGQFRRDVSLTVSGYIHIL